MAIVFWILVSYGLFFVFLAITSEGTDRLPSPFNPDRSIAFPARPLDATGERADIPAKVDLTF